MYRYQNWVDDSNSKHHRVLLLVLVYREMADGWTSAFFRSKTLHWYISSPHTIDQNNWAKNVIWLLAHLCCADFMQKIANASEILHLGQGQDWRRLDKSRVDLTRGHVAAILVSPGENVIELCLAPTSRNHQHRPLCSPQSAVYLHTRAGKEPSRSLKSPPYLGLTPVKHSVLIAS